MLKNLGQDGTLLLPTFNWDFCKGIDFNYKLTSSRSGSLTKVALSRKDFKRTINPIYSFVVSGKKKNYLSKMAHKNCFDFKSPFGFLIKNSGKNLFVNLDYKDSFTFVHVAEQKIGVNYRYLKKFKGNYVNGENRIYKKECFMYVRSLNFNGVTSIDEKMDAALIKKNAIKKIKEKDISFTVVDIPRAYKIMENDIKKKGILIYPKSFDVWWYI